MRTLTFIILLLVGVNVAAQDVHFSQFWNNPIHVNPALTGVIPADLRLATTYRNQWASVASPYKTFAFSGDYRFKSKGATAIGTGLHVHRDLAGDVNLSTTNVQVAISSIVDVGDHSEISLGLKGGFLQKSINTGNMRWGSQYQAGSYNANIDPNENGFNFTPSMKADVSAGIAWIYHSSDRYITANDNFNAQVGLAFNHINRPKTAWTEGTTDTLYSNFTFYSHLQIGIPNSNMSIVPGMLGMFQGPSREISAGALLKVEMQNASKITGFIKGAYISFGAYARFGDAIIPATVLEFDQYSIGVSYDFNTSGLQEASEMKGGMEVSLKFRTPNPYVRKGHKTKPGKPSL